MRSAPLGLLLAAASLAFAVSGCSDDETETTSSTDGGGASGGGGAGGEAGQGGQGAVGAQGGSGGAAAVCGDGMVAPAEGCDDNNTEPDDGCDATCAVEPGYECSGQPSVCRPICGDSVVIAPETCDDGDAQPLDGCSDVCVVEDGYDCPTPGEECILLDGSCAHPFQIALVDNSGTLEGNASGDTTTGGDDVPGAPCDGLGGGAGPDLIYEFTLPDVRDVTITVDFSSGYDGIFRVLTAPCDPEQYVFGEPQFGEACADQTGGDGVEKLGLVSLEAGTYYIAVDGYDVDDYGAFSIIVSAAGSFCGNGALDGIEECDDNNLISGDGCGQCLVEALYSCTDEPSVCTTSCGDGVVDFGVLEECDDGNTGNGDRCSDACSLEFTVADSEPNDSIVDAQTVVDGDIVVGTVDTGDFDVYALTLASDSWVTLEVYTSIDGDLGNYNGSGQLGPLVDCLPSFNVDPDLHLFDSGGNVSDTSTSIISDDADGVDYCAFIGLNEDGIATFLGAGTYYIRVDAYDDTERVPHYALDVRVDAPIGLGMTCVDEYDQCDPTLNISCNSVTLMCDDACGDGAVGTGEECDDGNEDDSDRCSNACSLNADVIDTEANDNFASAQPVGAGDVIKGSIDSAGGDTRDLYTFTVTADTWVILEQYTSVDGTPDNYNSSGNIPELDCEDLFGGTDPDLHLFDASGDPTDTSTALATDDYAGDDDCAYLGPNTDGADVLVGPGTYYIMADGFSAGSPVPQYAVDVQLFGALGFGDACDTALDLCNINGELVCDPSTNTCRRPTADLVDHGSWELFFGGNAFDLDAIELTFTPTGGSYGVVISAMGFATYPEVPGSGTVASDIIALTDDGSAQHTFTALSFPFFGTDYDDVFVNANGHLTFGVGDSEYFETVTDHFALPRISALFDDLSPQLGTVTVDEFADHVTITYDSVPGYLAGDDNDFQIQLFDTGIVVITYLGIDQTDGLVGVSAGEDRDNPPPELDFSAQTPATPSAGDLVINEVLANASGADANCDLALDADDDEFVELVNVAGVPLDLTGLTISDGTQVRHTFGALVVPAHASVVVYGGGTSACTGVLGVIASSETLGLGDAGDSITLGTGDTHAYAASTTGMSSTRDPELSGAFFDHNMIGGSSANFSPGLRAIGEAF